VKEGGKVLQLKVGNITLGCDIKREKPKKR